MKELALKLADELEPADFYSKALFTTAVTSIINNKDIKVCNVVLNKEEQVGVITITIDKERLTAWIISCMMKPDGMLSIRYEQVLDSSKN